MDKPKPGTIGWHDLTVPNADEVRDFYAKVANWTFEGLSMGDYEDYVMKTDGGDVVGGVCHRRGPNADLPPIWMMYIVVEDMEASLRAVREGGGEVLRDTRNGPAGMVVIKDPAGAVCALYQAE